MQVCLVFCGTNNQVGQLLAQDKSPYQSMAVFENPSLDKVLIIDDRIQLTSRDEAVYHEMFVHVCEVKS
jgi:spermidine synthase